MTPLLFFLLPAANAETVREAFPPPGGAERLPADAFGTWLGHLPLRPVGTTALTWDGRGVRGHPGRVVDLPLVPGDLQQCADSALRLRAEWQRELGQTPSFHATSGDPMPWVRYAAGERGVARGNDLQWVPGGDGTWEGWLVNLFTYAGSASLHSHDTVPAAEPRAGHVVVQPGFPGHVVVLLDVARTADGRLWVLVGEGFMPAMDFHVEQGPYHGWWPWKDGVDLPHWDLTGRGARAFR